MNFECLLLSAKAGNENAITTILQMYRPLLLKYAISLLHIGEKQDQNYPQSPECENAQKQPDLPGPAYQSHNCDDCTNQDRDAAAQKSSVIIHV